MAILDVINLFIKDNPSLFKEVENDFDDLIFLIVSYQKDAKRKTVNISLKTPFSMKYNLKISILERIETPLSVDFSYGYQIYRKEKIIDTNSILNYYRDYAVNFGIFFQYLEDSFFGYFYNKKKSLEKFEILEIDFIKILKRLELRFEKITALMNENLVEAKNGFFTFEDLFVYSGRDFSIDSVSIQSEAIENLIFTLEGKGKERLNYLVQIGDFVSDNEFLRIKDEKNNPNRNHYLEEVNKGNERKYDFSIYNLVVEYGKTDEIESVIIEYNGGIESEIFTLDMEYEIDGKIFKLVKFDFPIFTLLDSFDVQYFTSKNKAIRNAFIDKIDVSKSEIWDYINFKLPNFDTINISYITEPKIVLKFEGIIREENDKWHNRFFRLYLLPYPLLKKSRFKILIKNLLQYDFKDFSSPDEIFNLEKYYPIENLYDSQATDEYNDTFFYLYRNKQNDYLIINAIEEITKLPYYQNPFQLDYLLVSHLNQSIIRIIRKDDTPFTRNNRYVLLKYLYDIIPQNLTLKDSIYYMNKDTNKIIKELHNFDLIVKEFGILFDVVLPKKIIEEYRTVLNDTFTIYAEKEDIKEDIVNSLIDQLSSQKFPDGEPKFENIASSIRTIKEGYKYELRINYNFFTLPEEVLLIRYTIGTKYFPIDLLTTNNYHKNQYDASEDVLKKITLEQIPEFMEGLMIDPYFYIKDLDTNSITTFVDNVLIKFRNHKTNDIKEELIKIGMKWKDFEWLWNYATEDPNKIVTQISIIYNYEKDKIVSVEVASIEPNISIQSFKFALDYFIDDWIVIEFRTSEIIPKEIDLTEFYKDIDQVYIKIGDPTRDIDAEFFLFEKDSVFIDDVKEVMDLTGEFLIKNIKISSDNEEVVIESLVNNAETFRFTFRINNEIKDENVEKEILTTIKALCLGIVQDITKLESIEKALVVFLLPNGTLDSVGYKVGEYNPSFSLIDTVVGKIQEIFVSDDNLKIKLVLEGKEYIFEVDENILYTIYIFENSKYQPHIKDIPIFAIYRDEEALEEPKFEVEKVVFDINKFSTESAKKGVDIWIEEEKDWSEILKQIEKEPEIKKFEEIIEEKELDETIEEMLMKKELEKYREEAIKKKELKGEEEVEGIEEDVEDDTHEYESDLTDREKAEKEKGDFVKLIDETERLSEEEEIIEAVIERKEELEEKFEAETGKKAIWRGRETISYKEWRKSYAKEFEEETELLEEVIEEIEEKIEIKQDFIDLDPNELPEFWDSLSEDLRVYFGWNLTSGSCGKTDLKKQWDYLLCKDKLESSFLQLSKMTKELGYTISVQNEVELMGIQKWWNNLTVKERRDILEFFSELLTLYPTAIKSYELMEWNAIEDDIGFDLFKFLIQIKNSLLKYKELKGEIGTDKKKEKVETKKKFLELDLNELPEFWDSLSDNHKIALGVIFGYYKADELTQNWDNFLHKDDLNFYFLHLIIVTKGLEFTLTDKNEIETIGISGWWFNLSVKDRGSVLEIFADLLEFNENDIAEYKLRGWMEIESEIGLDLIQSLVTIKNLILEYNKTKKERRKEEKTEEITEENIGDMWNNLDIYGKKELLVGIGLGEEYAEHYAQFKWEDADMETIKDDLLQEEILDFITEWLREERESPEEAMEEAEEKIEAMVESHREKIVSIASEKEVSEEDIKKEKQFERNLKSAKRIYQSFEKLETVFIFENTVLDIKKENTVLDLKKEKLEVFWNSLCPKLRAVLIEYLNIRITEKRKEEEIYGAWDTFSFQRKVNEKIDNANDFLKGFMTLMDALQSKILDDFDSIWDSSSIVNRKDLLLKLGYDEGNADIYSSLSWDDDALVLNRKDFIKRATTKFMAENYESFIEQLLK